jgi:hypothetical protein
MFNFLEQQNRIEQFIKDNYKNYLEEYNISEPEVTTDFIDLDRFKNSFTLFIDFSKMNFGSSFDDDCSDAEKLQVSIFLVLRNDTSKNLRDRLLNASSAFYSMIKADNDFGVALSTTVNDLNYFNYVEGTKYIMMGEFSLTLNIEAV